MNPKYLLHPKIELCREFVILNSVSNILQGNYELLYLETFETPKLFSGIILA